MQKTPLVSIVLPTYNHEPYLLESVRSILGCGISDLEVLICDDCSTDASYAKCLEGAGLLRDSKIPTGVFQNKKNLGVAATLKHLVVKAKGEFICPLASDDYILPDGVKNRINVFGKNPKTRLVIADCMAVGPESQMLCPSFAEKNNFSHWDFTKEKIAATLSIKWDYPLNVQCWKRDFFKVHGGEFEFEPSVFCEDLPAALRAGSKEEIGFCQIPCIGYRCKSWPQVSGRCPVTQWKDLGFIYGKYSQLYTAKSREILRLTGERYYFLSIGETQLAEARWEQALALSQAT
jgi:glycosyltransferase involved in cell wall biosynthesis